MRWKTKDGDGGGAGVVVRSVLTSRHGLISWDSPFLYNTVQSSIKPHFSHFRSPRNQLHTRPLKVIIETPSKWPSARKCMYARLRDVDSMANKF